MTAVPPFPARDHRASPIGRAVVDDHDLLVELEGPDPLEHLADRGRLVVGGDDERDAHY